MMWSPFWTIFLFPLLRAGRLAVPGCPSVDVLENDDKIDENTLKNLLLCFCEVSGQKNVAISCLYGSNPDHLKRATDAVKNATMTTTSIHIQHMEFPETGVPKLGGLAPELKSVEIRECTSQEPLIVAPDVFMGLEGKLENVTIHSCNLMEVPEALNGLAAVKNLDLSSNKLMELDPKLFENKKQLNYLDISNNQLGTIPEGTFAPLDQLETLVAGDHNYMNETFLAEIGNLKNLKTLDLSRGDGVFEPPMDLFNSLPQLEELKLSGCSISKLDPGIFSPLKSLKMLDLRVNLIENVSDYAFDGLGQLERLTFAGNYIRDLGKDVWIGLDNLKELDIGWNELKELQPGSLASLDKSLTSLNLRHNPMTTFPSTGLTNLEELLLSETQLDSLQPEAVAEYKKLEKLDLSGCNITTVASDVFQAQKNSLKVLNLSKNHLKTLSPEVLEGLPQLEELDISRNPILCDDQMGNFISAIEDRYKTSAKEGKEFLLSNANETLCARPYSLKGQTVFELDPDQLEAYDESSDTTTTSTAATTAAFEEDELSTPLVIPNLFIGSKSNETLFKEEPRRDVYDLSNSDNIKGSGQGATGATLLWTAIILGIVTLITVAAVLLFIRKRKQMDKVAPDTTPKKKPQPTATIEDGMEEIELNARS